jgi:DNA-binding CsgD family transcriptional regulator
MLDLQRLMAAVFGLGPQTEVVVTRPDELASLVEQALPCLTGRQRQALLLRFNERLSLREAGGEMGITRQAVKNHEARALRRLRHHRLGRAMVACFEYRVMPWPSCEPSGWQARLDAPPGWLTVMQAGAATDLSNDHLRHLACGGRVKTQKLRGHRLYEAASLRSYVLAPSPHGRRRGVWHQPYIERRPNNA